MAMVKVAATPPDRLKKNVGLRNVPQRIELRITLNRVTVNASRKPRNTSVTRVITYASPSLIHVKMLGFSCFIFGLFYAESAPKVVKINQFYLKFSGGFAP